MWLSDRRQDQARFILPRDTDSDPEENPSIHSASPLGVAMSDLEATMDFFDFYFPLPPTLSSAASSTALTVGEGVSGSTDTHGIQSDPQRAHVRSSA